MASSTTQDLSVFIPDSLNNQKVIATLTGCIAAGIAMLVIISALLCCYREPWERPWPFRRSRPQADSESQHGSGRGSSVEALVEIPLGEVGETDRGRKKKTEGDKGMWLEVPRVGGRWRRSA